MKDCRLYEFQSVICCHQGQVQSPQIPRQRPLFQAYQGCLHSSRKYNCRGQDHPCFTMKALRSNRNSRQVHFCPLSFPPPPWPQVPGRRYLALCFIPTYPSIQKIQIKDQIRSYITRIIYTMRIFLFLVLVISVLGKGLTYAQLQTKLMERFQSPFVNLMFVYDGSSQMGPALKTGIDEIGKKRQGHFQIFSVDCDSDDEELHKNFPYCSDDIRPKLPVLFFTEPLLNPADLKKGEAPNPKSHNYAGSLQDKALYDFAVPLMKLYSMNLKKSNDWKQFQEKYPETPKVIYFTDKDKITPFFKTLTAHFRSTIAFAHVFKNSSLCEQLGVTTFPTLLLNGQTKIEMTKDLLIQVEILKEHAGPETQIIIEELKAATEELNKDNLQEKIYENARHILVHVPGKDGKPHPEWQKSQSSFKKMFDYFESQSLASTFGVKHRPAIVYFPKSLAQKDVKKTVFHPTDNFRIIYDQISSLIEDFTIPLASDKQMQKITSIALKEGRFISVLFHKDDISLSYRVLSNDDRFKEEMTFIRMKNPPPDVMQKFSVKKLPSLFIMTVDDSNSTQEESQPQQELESGQQAYKLQLAQYTGKFNYDDLESYLKYFLKTPKIQQESISKVIEEYSSKKKFDKNCANGQNCYLLLLNGDEENKEKNNEYISILKKNMGDVVYNTGYVDAVCHSQILAKLEIQQQELPVLVYLNSNFEKYSRLIGRIEDKSLQNFIAKVKANKGIWRFYESIVFSQKNCEEEHQKIKKLQESSYQMSEEEAAILEEVRKQEQEKKQQAGVGQKESRRRKKKRRPRDEDSQL